MRNLSLVIIFLSGILASAPELEAPTLDYVTPAVTYRSVTDNRMGNSSPNLATDR